jgi:hypothetical protein
LLAFIQFKSLRLCAFAVNSFFSPIPFRSCSYFIVYAQSEMVFGLAIQSCPDISGHLISLPKEIPVTKALPSVAFAKMTLGE